MKPAANIRLFIDGEFADGSTGAHFPAIDPATGEVFGQVQHATADDVDRAATAAKRALSGPWGRMSAVERAAMLDKIADAIDARAQDFLDAEVRDTGKPLAAAASLDIPRGAANFRAFADLARGFAGDFFETPTPDGRGALNYVLRRPVGVVGVICPWNLPLLLMTWKVAPALACGNTVVVKPSEETPSTATLLGEVMNEVGVPPGVYNVVHGFGPDDAGQQLVRHPAVAAVTFTGESRTGQAIMRDAAPGVKPLSFELGGKNAALIFEDADFDTAIDGTVRSVFSNCGQVCLCSERVFVQRSIYERFCERLAAQAIALRTGDPLDSATQMGPLISAAHREKVLGYFEGAKADGAEVLAGGGAAQVNDRCAGGFFVEPTIFAGLDDHARLNREEVFGPVCHISPFDDEDEAILRANDSDYGLCAAVWTNNLARAHRVAGALQVGITWVNAWYLRDLRTPFGGTKLSGIGREGGQSSLDFYTEQRNICVKL